MNTPLSQDETWLLTEKYHGEKTQGFFTDCERLASGEPLAYVIGHTPFLGCTIYLDSHPLIPRPETEFWVEKAIAVIKSTPLTGPLYNSHNVLDLCAGSGCIGVAVAHALSRHVEVHFAEADQRHFELIHNNMSHNGIDNTRIPVFISDLFETVGVGPYIGFKYDFILSNPPYIDPALDRAEPSVKNYEPHLALYGGYGGSELLEKIIVTAPSHLNPHGQLWLEHEPEQTTLINSLGEAQQFIVTTHPDQFGTLRYSQLVLQ